MRLPRTTWVPGEGGRPDDEWLKEVDKDLLVDVGALLFERGQGFEAHEAWELAWREAKAAGRADEERVLRALIKLAAAMVKVRQRLEVGVRQHAHGAGALLDEIDAPAVLGFDVAALRALARRVEAEPLPACTPAGEPMFGRLARDRR